MKLSIPCTWDDELLRFLETSRRQSKKYPVVELYGSMMISTIGCGRDAGALMTKCRKRSDIESFVQKIHQAGYKFNYTINSSCLGNAEYNYLRRKKIVDELEWILSFSDSVTVTIPYLIDLVRQIAGNRVEIVGSVIAQVDTPQKLAHFVRLGINRVVLSMSFNRDVRRIAAIKKISPIPLEIIVNNSCLYECPYDLMHYNEDSHASQPRELFYPDYCLTKCLMDRLDHPEEILKSRWIRPEDLAHYEPFIAIVKIAGRGKPTQWIINTVDAYASGSYSGSIFDLLTVVAPRGYDTKSVRQNIAPPFQITNDSLDTFMKQFYSGDHECIDCGTCRYCREFAGQHLQVNTATVEVLKKELTSKLQPLLGGGGISLFLKEAVLRSISVSHIKNGIIWKILHHGRNVTKFLFHR